MTGRLVFGLVFLVDATTRAAGTRRRVFLEDDRGRRHTIGYVRHVERRWFAEDADRLPLEGTFRTRQAAGDAIVDAIEARS